MRLRKGQKIGRMSLDRTRVGQSGSSAGEKPPADESDGAGQVALAVMTEEKIDLKYLEILCSRSRIVRKRCVNERMDDHVAMMTPG